jgi:hypothetical protein
MVEILTPMTPKQILKNRENLRYSHTIITNNISYTNTIINITLYISYI